MIWILVRFKNLALDLNVACFVRSFRDTVNYVENGALKTFVGTFLCKLTLLGVGRLFPNSREIRIPCHNKKAPQTLSS